MARSILKVPNDLLLGALQVLFAGDNGGSPRHRRSGIFLHPPLRPQSLGLRLLPVPCARRLSACLPAGEAVAHPPGGEALRHPSGPRRATKALPR